jgi:hypothetical protein
MDGLQTAGRSQALHRFHIWLALGLALASLVVGLTASASARAVAAKARAASAPLPLQGIYGYCAPATSPDGCVGRLRQIAAAGFRVVVNYQAFNADRSQLERYMRVAQSVGVKLIWPMQDSPWWGSGSLTDLYPALAARCGCSDNQAFAKYLIGLVRNSPATWGYYLSDEQSPKDAALVAAFSQRLRALDPQHPRLAIAVGDNDVTSLLSPYAAAADVLGADSYPIGVGQPISRVRVIASKVAKVARSTHRRSAMVLQSFNWADYPDVMPNANSLWPTREQMRQMRDLAIQAAHPSLILWYSYFDIQKSADAARHWSDLAWAAFGSQLLPQIGPRRGTGGNVPADAGLGRWPLRAYG